MAENAPVIISVGVLPEDYCFTDFQTLFNDFGSLLTAYVSGTYNFFNFGDTEPAAEDRDKPWFRTVAGAPDRWYVYTSGAWLAKHEVPASGSERRLWVGTTTELKTYDGGEDTAITATTGPFWQVDTDFDGRSPIGVGTIPGRTISPTSTVVGDNIGEAEHEQTVAELAEHNHLHPATQDSVAVTKGGNGIGLDFTGGSAHVETTWTDNEGDDDTGEYYSSLSRCVFYQTLRKGLPEGNVMARSTLADAKSSRIPSTLNVSSTDARFLQYLNEAMSSLLIRMKPWGCYQRVAFCVTDSCVVLPRQIASIDSVWVNERPIPIRNQWFEYLDSGFGLQGTDTTVSNQNSGLQWIDRGTTCVYSDIVGTNKKVRVYADVTEATGAKILIQGYDENDNWIRTLVSGSYIDGEYVSLEATPNFTTNFFSAITSVQKPVTNGFVRLYEYDTDASTQRQIALYEPDETRPDYRKAFIDGLDAVQADEDGNKHITVEAKLDFIPARIDTDFLTISNLTALKYGCQAIQKAERNLWQESEVYMTKALAELQFEIKHFEGAAAIVPIKFQHPQLFGASGLNVI